jgi:hypothetical protein
MRSAELVGVAQTIACCGEVSRVSGRGQVAQRGVRPGLIIRNHPPCDGGAGVIEMIEERLVEKFVAHAAIECLADPSPAMSWFLTVERHGRSSLDPPPQPFPTATP